MADMEATSPSVSGLSHLLGEEVVLDTVANYVIAGRLLSTNAACVTLADADVHDLRDSKSSRELYVIETKRLGVRVNRKQVMVRWQEVVAISRLADVVI